jgi:hypothetical protein
MSFTMEEQPARPGRERRRSDRIPVRALVEIRLPTWEALRSVHLINVSRGGMRLSVGAGASVGTAIDIMLTLPNGERLHLPGRIANLGASGSGDIGVQFDPLPPHTQSEIERYVGELKAGRTPAPRSEIKDIPSGVLIKKKS